MADLEPMAVIPPKTGVITEEDKAFANSVVATFPECFLGGSYIVNGDDAHDIDVVVPHSIWPAVRSHFAGQIGKVQKEIPTEDEDITEEDRLVCVYRRGNVDLLVIRDTYVGTYRAAVEAMKANPELYRTREERVRLHVRLADELRLEHGWDTEEIVVARRRKRYGKGGSSGDYT